MQIFNFHNIPILAKTDLLIVGGGSAGASAAITAGKLGLSVSLIERYGFLGGSSTQMLDTFYGFYTPGDHPKKIVGGTPSMVVDELNAHGEVFLRPNTYGAGTGVNYNPERLKWLWDKQLKESGVSVFLHTILLEVEKNENAYNCIVWTKEGIFKIAASYVIDASGDADFCHHAGFEYEIAGQNEPAQSMTTTFRMANVDLEKYQNAGGKKLLSSLMEEAVEQQKYELPRKSGSAHEMNIPSCISTVAVKVVGQSGLEVTSLTQAEQEGRKQAFNYEAFFRGEVPGFENSKIIGLSNQIGVRETRRVFGQKRLDKEHCMSAKLEEDSVLLCGAPIEDHRQGKNGEQETYWEYVPNNGVYGVPYGTLVPKSSSRVWVVGRCFSATHDAHASCRSMAQTMAMGQAASTAAFMAIKSSSDVNVSISKLRELLVENGAILEMPIEISKTGKSDW